MGQPREKRPAPSADDSLNSDPNLDDDQDVRTLLAQVVADNKTLKQAYADLNARVSQFLEINSSLVVENARLVSENEALRNQNRALQQRPALTSPVKTAPSLPTKLAQLSSQVKMTNELASIREKSFQAVIERLDDSKTPDQDKNDKDFVDAICAEAGIPCPEEVFRHQCDAKRRPLKIRFASTYSRDLFIRRFRHSIPVVSLSCPLNPRCRRDMTLTELSLLRSLRKKAYEDNVKAGIFKYFVRDLEIVETDKPRKFVVSTKIKDPTIVDTQPAAPSSVPEANDMEQ
ncbi:unnamed protein product [Caenorhabditis auriculariae]|uniref:Uncharacterized protein n=1 Tax=Caenorhabditis auriculariae TaxID=2777116 RepID=A0A8S1GXA2_9PELO|nr:unnamed protein product [Caenorhabditis auriculariae]